MKKLFRLLLVVLFVNLIGTSICAMTDQNDVKSEQKIPHIKSKGGEDLIFEIRTELLPQGFSPASIVDAIKKQKIDVNVLETYGFSGGAFLGLTALQIQERDIIQLAEETGEQIKICETVIKILVDAGAHVDAKTLSKYQDLIAMLAKSCEEFERLKTPEKSVEKMADLMQASSLS